MKKLQFALLVVVIVICAGGIFGYVYNKLDKIEKNKTEENKTEEKENNNGKEENKTSLVIEEGVPSNIIHYEIDNELKSYLDMVPLDYIGYHKDAYDGDYLTVYDMEELLYEKAESYASNKATYSEKEEIKNACESHKKDVKSELFEGFSRDETETSGVLINYIDEYLKNNYNITSTSFKNTSFTSFDDSLSVRYNKYYCIYHCNVCGHGVPFSPEKITVKVDAEKNDNELIIIEKVFFPLCDEMYCSISSNTLFDYSNLYNDDELYDNNKLIDALYTKLKPYEDQANTFKHTFKKASDGKFYYYSTEAIK